MPDTHPLAAPDDAAPDDAAPDDAAPDDAAPGPAASGGPSGGDPAASGGRGLLRVVTAGSVDDGKSTLIGRLLYDSKSIFEDQLDAVARASPTGSLDLSLVTDGLRAEREQGITIDVAYRYFATPRRTFVVADTPGHVQYTRNTVTGASTADLALLLVDVTRGVQTQTRRHAFVASLLGLRHVVVAVNKMDAVGYDRAAFDAVVAEFAAFAVRLDLPDTVFVPVSALRGDHVVERGDAMPWYDGPTLLHHLEHVQVAGDRNLRDLRFPVQTVLRSADGPGPRALAGTVASGTIRPGDPVLALPSGARSTVASVATIDGPLAGAPAGRAVAVTLADDVDVGRGEMLVRPGNLPTVASELDAMVCWMDPAPLRPGRRYRLRHTTRELAAEVEVVYRVDVDTLHRETAETLGFNDIGRVRVTTGAPVCVDPYAVNRETGAFVLVDPDTHATVAAGVVRGRAVRPAQAVRAAWTGRTERPVSPDVVWQGAAVSLAERERAQGHRAAVVWFTGLPGAGKTTVAREVERRLFASGVRTALLDGDRVRHGLSGDLGFSPADRRENVRRVGEVARLLVESGAVALCAFVSPDRADRDRVRALLPEGRFVEVWVDVDVETARRRDPKGLYARADAGEIDLTGVTAPYDPPLHAEVVLDTARQSVAHSADAVVAALARAGILGDDARPGGADR